MSKALDDLRKGERKHNDAIKGHKYTLLRNYESLTYILKTQLDDLFEIYPRIGTAYHLKHMFKQFWEFSDRQEAEGFLAYWRDKVDDTDIQSLKNVARTLRAHWTGVMNYIDSHITSGIMEGVNNKIQLAKRRARGYRNRKNFINIIYFITGKLTFDYPHYPL